MSGIQPVSFALSVSLPVFAPNSNPSPPTESRPKQADSIIDVGDLPDGIIDVGDLPDGVSGSRFDVRV